MAELWQALGQVLTSLLHVLRAVQPYSLVVLLLVAWMAWWLWAVNWSRAWAVLAAGAWVPIVLLMLVAALVWSRIAPEASFNGWAQLAWVGALVALALFCGWLQGALNWTPTEIALEPPEHGHAEAHGHETVPHA